MSTTNLPGSSLLANRYRLVERLGAGGMSVVWRGFDEVLGRQVAVKVLPPSTSTDPAFRRRLRAEAQAAARLSHPHITNVYDYGEATTADGEPVPYVVMELIDGESLAAILARVRRLSWQSAVRITAEVAAALAAAHSRGIVHRDVTPANVMLTPSGAKVVDFGISALIGENDIDPDGSLLGTPAYLAPERLEGGQVSPATDVYAVGLLVYRTLIGQLPWDVGTTTALLRAHQYIEPEPLPYVEGLPRSVAALVGRCLEKRPDDRPSSAELAHVLAGVAAASADRGYTPDWSAESAEDTTILPSQRSWTENNNGRLLGSEYKPPMAEAPSSPSPAGAAAAAALPAAMAAPASPFMPGGDAYMPPMPGAESGPLAGAAARNSRFAALRGGPELNTPPGDAAAGGDGNPSLRPAFGNQPPPPPEPPLDRGPAGGTGDSPSKRFLNRHTRRVLVVATAVVLLTAGTYAWSLASSRSSDKPAATPLPSVVPPTGKCVVSYAVYSEANGRFSAQVTLANRNDGALKNWKLWFIMPGDQTISGNGKVRLQQQQHTVTVTSAAALNAQKAVTMPITGRYTANNTAPLAFRLNGYTCETYVSSKPGEPAKQVEHLSDGTVKLSTTPATSSPVVGVSVDPTGGVHITPTTAPAANPTQTIPQGGGVVVTTTPAADATTTGGVTVTTPTADASTTVAPDPGETKADPTTTPPTTVPTATTPAPPGGDGPSVNCEPTATEDC